MMSSETCAWCKINTEIDFKGDRITHCTFEEDHKGKHSYEVEVENLTVELSNTIGIEDVLN